MHLQPTIWVGTYSEQGGQGLYPINPTPSGGWAAGEPFGGAKNASFGARSSRHRLRYLVDERGDALGVYRQPDGWSALASVPTGGKQPCYIGLAPDETLLAVANYGSGSIALFQLDPATGLPNASPTVQANSGDGPNRDRQEGPHAHCACFSPDGKWLYQVDLGTDEIMAFELPGRLENGRCAFRAPPGSGPRHLLFHPGGPALLISELASSVHLLEPGAGQLKTRQLISTLPPEWSGDSLGGHIGTNASGDRVYVTNRGHDSIGIFAFDGDRLALMQHVESGGASPRHFLLLEVQKLMFVANEEGGNVTAFQISDDGTLRPAGIDIAIPGPVFMFEDDAAQG